MNHIEAGIIGVLKQGIPLREIEIARTLGVSRRLVNHYLYTSLKRWVVQDTQYRWMLQSIARSTSEQLTLALDWQPARSHVTSSARSHSEDAARSALDELLSQHQHRQQQAVLEQTLRSLTDSPEG